MNKQNIKCLFGYHKYEDEQWLIKSWNNNLITDYINADHAFLIMCNCRSLCQFIWNVDDDDPWVMIVIKEHPSYLILKSPMESIYRFDKQEGTLER